MSDAPAQRVEFFVLEENSAPARLRLACRIVEKAYLASQSVLVWHTDPEELRSFDEMLWTFADRSFVPHEYVPASGGSCEAPVQLSAGQVPASPVDVLVNLAPDIPACASIAPRIAEVLDGDEARRRAGRVRFKAYRDLGLQPVSHNVRDAADVA